jgi:hypothetical protein
LRKSEETWRKSEEMRRTWRKSEEMWRKSEKKGKKSTKKIIAFEFGNIFLVHFLYNIWWRKSEKCGKSLIYVSDYVNMLLTLYIRQQFGNIPDFRFSPAYLFLEV